MAQYLDKAGLQVLWTKIKDHDTSTLNAAKNDAASKDTALKNELTGVINGVNADVTTLKGYFTNGAANKAIADKNGADIAATYIPLTQKGVANGIATLGSDGKVPAAQLPSYVDDVIEGYCQSSTEFLLNKSDSSSKVTGESGKIYVDLNAGKTFRWSGSQFVEISASLALGETSSTAYAGNKGKANADAIAALEQTVEQLQTDFGDWTTTVETDYQEKLVSGTNIKTVNGVSILGSGNITIDVENIDMSGYYTKGEVDAGFVALTGNQTIDGIKTFKKPIVVKETYAETDSTSTAYYNGAIVTETEDGEYSIEIPVKGGEMVVKNNNLIELPSGGIIYKDGINANEYAGFVVSPTGVPVVISKDLELCFTRTNDYVMYTNVYTFPDKNGTVALTSDLPTALTTDDINEVCV